MNVIKELAEQIRDEIPNLERAIKRALQAWQYAIAEPDRQEFYIDSASLNLQSFYTGIERLFSLIAKHIDCSLPTGKNWHSDLLWQMASDLSNIRPAVIKTERAAILDEFRGFRHRVRNIYSSDILPENVGVLILTLNASWSELYTDLLAFAEFLDELA
ncbi:MAG: antitoxin [Candidatus Poribacteria bacterium]